MESFEDLSDELSEAMEECFEKIVISSPSLHNNKEVSEKVNSFKHIRFSGKNDRNHPILFIETFETMSRDNNLNDYDKQYHLKESLIGEAAEWISNCQFETYEEMKNALIHFYWSESKQQMFIEQLEEGIYDENCGLSVSDYFYKFYNWAKYLDSYDVTASNLIQSIMLHFEEYDKDINTNISDTKDLNTSDTSNSLLQEEEELTSIPETPKGQISNSQDNQNNSRFKNIMQFAIFFVMGIFLGLIFTFVSFYSLGKFNSQLISNENNNNLQEISKLQKLNPFQKLKFSGNKDSINPKQFIKNFEYIANQEKLNARIKEYYFIQSLVDDAESWILTRSFGSYEEMKEDFLKFYWGYEIQDEFIKFLMNGKYNEESGLSPREYFYKNFNVAVKFLDAGLTDKFVIDHLLKHFSFNVRIKEVLQVKSVETFDEALELLVPSNLVLRKARDLAQVVSYLFKCSCLLFFPYYWNMSFDFAIVHVILYFSLPFYYGIDNM